MNLLAALNISVLSGLLRKTSELYLRMASAVKYDWHQSDTAVTITILLKNAVDKNYSVVFGETSEV